MEDPYERLDRRLTAASRRLTAAIEADRLSEPGAAWEISEARRFARRVLNEADDLECRNE